MSENKLCLVVGVATLVAKKKTHEDVVQEEGVQKTVDESSRRASEYLSSKRSSPSSSDEDVQVQKTPEKTRRDGQLVDESTRASVYLSSTSPSSSDKTHKKTHEKTHEEDNWRRRNEEYWRRRRRERYNMQLKCEKEYLASLGYSSSEEDEQEDMQVQETHEKEVVMETHEKTPSHVSSEPPPPSEIMSYFFILRCRQPCFQSEFLFLNYEDGTNIRVEVFILSSIHLFNTRHVISGRTGAYTIISSGCSMNNTFSAG